MFLWFIKSKIIFILIKKNHSFNNKGIRHACDQGDKLDEYSFKKHDGRNFAIQTLSDSINNVKLRTELLKIPGGNHGMKYKFFFF